MDTKVSFEDFLKQKSTEKETLLINKEELKKEWIESVYNLYDKIEKWLQPFEQKNLLTISRNKIITIDEEIGNYEIQQMDIRIGTETIHLVPIARQVIGAKGRIDMESETGDIKILRYGIGNGTWKFIQKIVKMETWEVNNKSFKIELQNLAS